MINKIKGLKIDIIGNIKKKLANQSKALKHLFEYALS